jgi:hypothetical protein
MIRQLETPWQSRALVILDLRWSAYESEQCFEKAVRGAASIVRHLAREGFDADLWAGGVALHSDQQYGAVMEKLAVVEREGRLDIRAVASRLKSVGRGGALVLVTGIPDSDLLEVQRLMSREYRTTVVLSASETSSSGEIAFQRAGSGDRERDPERIRGRSMGEGGGTDMVERVVWLTGSAPSC